MTPERDRLLAEKARIEAEHPDKCFTDGVRQLAEIIREQRTANWLSVAEVLDHCAENIDRLHAAAPQPTMPNRRTVMNRDELMNLNEPLGQDGVCSHCHEEGCEVDEATELCPSCYEWVFSHEALLDHCAENIDRLHAAARPKGDAA